MIARSTADAARVAAMAAVLAIHATQAPSAELVVQHDPWTAAGLAALINQVSRFCVPMFVLLSGLALAAREQAAAAKAGLDRPRVAAVGFYADRLATIALPFVIWSLIYRLCDAPWSQGPGAAAAWVARQLPIDLLTGGAQYHLYFVAIIVQCYLLFPWLLQARSPWWTVGLFALALVFTSPAHTLLLSIGIERPELPSFAFPAWLCWFQLGIQSGLRPTPATEPGAAQRGAALVAVGVGMGMVCTEWWSYSWRLADPGWFGHFHRWTVMGYVAACWWALVTFDGPIRRWLQPPRRAGTLTLLVCLSFAIYLGHPLVLRALGRFGCPANPLIRVPALIVLSVGAAALVGALLKRRPAVARALGW